MGGRDRQIVLLGSPHCVERSLEWIHLQWWPAPLWSQRAWVYFCLWYLAGKSHLLENSNFLMHKIEEIIEPGPLADWKDCMRYKRCNYNHCCLLKHTSVITIIILKYTIKIFHSNSYQNNFTLFWCEFEDEVPIWFLYRVLGRHYSWRWDLVSMETSVRERNIIVYPPYYVFKNC